jgi:mannan endo-1,4-beta-mannosidase
MAINEGPDGIEKVDFIIAEAQKRDIKLILAFLDFWDYTGGAQQIRSWYGSADKYTFFFEDPRTKRDYKQWVDYVVNRLNPKTKLHYRDDPTIMAWELMNEPNAKPMELRQEWTAEMSAYVKKLDSNHLVGTGHANADWHHFDINTDLAVDTVDYGTWHGYPKYFQITADQMNNLIPHYCAFGEAFHKPVLFEEFGYARSHRDQAEVYRKWLDTLVGDRNCAGWAVWRLVSRQDDGSFPADEVEQFDIRNDGSKIWQVLQMETKKGIGRDD